MGFQKLNSKIIAYRDYKNFDNAKFRYEMVTATSNLDNFGMYKSTIFKIFNRHVTIRKKYSLTNKALFTSKELHKTIMKSKVILKILTIKKLLISLMRIVLPLFTQNSSKGEKINLVDDGETISSDEELCETFNQFFANVVPILNIPKPKAFSMTGENLSPIMSIIKSFKKHPSIVKIKTKSLDSTFHFRETSCNEVEKITSNLYIKKSFQQEDAPTKIIKLNKDLIAKFIAENFNSCIVEGINIVLIHKMKYKSDKSNYRAVSILSNCSKLYEKLMYNQLYQYFKNIFFPSQCGF